MVGVVQTRAGDPISDLQLGHLPSRLDHLAGARVPERNRRADEIAHHLVGAPETFLSCLGENLARQVGPVPGLAERSFPGQRDDRPLGPQADERAAYPHQNSFRAQPRRRHLVDREVSRLEVLDDRLHFLLPGHDGQFTGQRSHSLQAWRSAHNAEFGPIL